MTRKRNLGRKLKVFRLLLVLGLIVLGGPSLFPAVFLAPWLLTNWLGVVVVVTGVVLAVRSRSRALHWMAGFAVGALIWMA